MTIQDKQQLSASGQYAPLLSSPGAAALS